MNDKLQEIVHIINQHQLQSLARKEAMQDARDRTVAAKADYVEYILGGKDVDPAMPVSHYILKSLYYHMLLDYTGDRYIFEKEPNAHSKALWKRVEAARQDSGADAQTFMRAQFAWFDKHFGTYPRLMQLTTSEAVKRAVEFEGNSEKRVVGVKEAPVKRTDMLKETEKLIQSIMRAQKCTRLEFYKKFVLTGLQPIPEQFLRLDPVYTQAKGAK